MKPAIKKLDFEKEYYNRLKDYGVKTFDQKYVNLVLKSIIDASDGYYIYINDDELVEGVITEVENLSSPRRTRSI